MQVAFETAYELSNAIDELLKEAPAALYYHLDSVAPFPDFQSHNGIEMYYVWEGTGAYLVGNQVYVLQPGTLVITKPYTAHKILQTEPGLGVHRHVFIWHESLLSSYRFNSNETNVSKLVPKDSICIYSSGREREMIESLYSTAHEELKQKFPGYIDMLRSIVIQLLTISFRLFERQHQEELPGLDATSLPPEIIYLIQYIGSGFQQPLPLAKLSDLVHMNPAYLTTLFRKHTGFSIGKFITEKRIHHAKKLLRETSLPISIIAHESGFTDSSYFIKMFKRHAGITPDAFRLKYVDRE